MSRIWSDREALLGLLGLRNLDKKLVGYRVFWGGELIGINRMQEVNVEATPPSWASLGDLG